MFTILKACKVKREMSPDDREIDANVLFGMDAVAETYKNRYCD